MRKNSLFSRRTVFIALIFFSIVFVLFIATNDIISGPVEGKDPEWEAGGGGMVTAIDITPDGEYILSGSAGGRVLYFHKDNPNVLWADYPSDWVDAVSISSDGSFMAAAGGLSYDGYLRMYNDTGDGEPMWEFDADNSIQAVEVSADGKYLVAGEGDHYAHLFSFDNSTPLWSFWSERGIRDVTISANGSYLAVGSVDDHVYFFHRDSSTPLWSHDIGACWTVDMTADGNYIVAGGNGYPDSAYLFERSSSEPIGRYYLDDWVESVSIADDGRHIAAGGRDNKVYLFDRESDGEVWSYETGGRVDEVSISTNGKYIAAISWDTRVYFFESSGSDPEWTYATEDDGYCVAIAEHEQYIAAGSRDGNVYLFHDSAIHTGPVAYIDEVDQNPALLGESIHFRGSGSIPYSDISEYSWYSSRDGVFGSSAEFNSSDLSKGTHIITFKFRDSEGNWTPDTSIPLLVHDKPVAEILELSPDPATIDEMIQFSGQWTDDDPIIDFLWTSSIEGTLSTDPSFSLSGLTTGTHTISFSVMDDNGAWSDEVTTELTVHRRPTAEIDSVLPVPCLETDVLTMDWDAEDDGSIVVHEWSVINDSGTGEEIYSGSVPPEILPPGDHVISLRVKDDLGAWSLPSEFAFEVVEIYCEIRSIHPEIALRGQPVMFQGSPTSSSGIVRSVWTSDLDGELYNGSSSNFVLSELSPLSPGTHTISYRALNSNGSWSSDVTAELPILDSDFRFVNAIRGDILAIETMGSYLYVGHGANLEIYDLTDPTDPVLMSSTMMRGSVSGISIQGDFAYVESAYYYFTIMDISDRTDPQILGSYLAEDWLRPPVIRGNFAYLFEYRDFIILDISNPWNPYRISSIDFQENGWSVCISGNYAYLANYDDGVRIVDISDPHSPFVAHTIEAPGSAYRVAIRDNHLYVSRNGGNFSIYDVTDPLDPISVLENSTIYRSNIVLQDDLMYLVGTYGGVSIYDMTDVSDPELLGTYDYSYITYYSAVSKEAAYIVHSPGIITIVDVSDPYDPSFANEIPGQRNPEWTATDGSTLFVGHEYDAIRMYDLQTPNDPPLLSSLVHYKDIRDLVYDDGYLFVANGYNGISILDVSDPLSPFNVSTLDTPGTANKMIKSGDHLFLAENDKGVVIVNVTDKDNPTIQDSYDSNGNTECIALYNGYLYIETWNSFEVLDVRDRSNIVYVTKVQKEASPRNLEVFNGYLFSHFGTEMFIYDLADPADPEAVASWEVGYYTYAWTQNGDTVYHTRSLDGIYVQDLLALPEIEEQHISNFISTSYSDMVCVGNYLYNADGGNGLMIIELAPVGWFEGIDPIITTNTDTVQFDAGATPDMEISTYLWTSDIDGTIYDGPNPSFSKNGFTPGEHTITLKVMEESGIWSTPISTMLTISQGILASIESVSPSPAASDQQSLTLSGSVTGGSVDRYVWTSDLDGEIANGTTAQITIPPLSTLGLHTISLHVIDIYGMSFSGGTISVILHQRPTVDFTSVSHALALDTDTIRIESSAQDPDQGGLIVRYVWSSSLDGELLNDSSSQLTTSQLSVGTHIITLVVEDGLGAWSEPQAATVNIHSKPIAEITSVDPVLVNEGGTVTFTGQGTDDGSIRRYIWTSSIDGELFNGTETEFRSSSLSVGTHTIFLVVLDDHDVRSEEVTTTIEVLVNTGPAENGDDPEFPFNKLGPLPVVAYIILLVVIIGAVLGFLKRGGGYVWEDPAPSQEPAPIPHPQQQEHLHPQAALPQQLQSYQQQSTSQLQFQKQQPPAAPPHPPPLQSMPSTQWTCSSCNQKVDLKFSFCLNCGAKQQ